MAWQRLLTFCSDLLAAAPPERDPHLVALPPARLAEVRAGLAYYGFALHSRLGDAGRADIYLRRYQEHLGLTAEVLDRVGREFAESDPNVLEATRIEGVEEFSGLGTTIRTRTRVAPGQHDRLARALRQKIKAAFDAEGIELALPPRGARRAS